MISLTLKPWENESEESTYNSLQAILNVPGHLHPHISLFKWSGRIFHAQHIEDQFARITSSLEFDIRTKKKGEWGKFLDLSSHILTSYRYQLREINRVMVNSFELSVEEYTSIVSKKFNELATKSDMSLSPFYSVIQSLQDSDLIEIVPENQNHYKAWLASFLTVSTCKSSKSNTPTADFRRRLEGLIEANKNYFNYEKENEIKFSLIKTARRRNNQIDFASSVSFTTAYGFWKEDLLNIYEKQNNLSQYFLSKEDGEEIKDTLNFTIQNTKMSNPDALCVKFDEIIGGNWNTNLPSGINNIN